MLRGQTYQVVGRDPNARWFLLQLSGKQGWALGYYLYFNTNEFNAPVTSDFVLGGNPAAATGVVAQSEATLRLRAQPTVASEQIGRVTWGGALALLPPPQQKRARQAVRLAPAQSSYWSRSRMRRQAQVY